MFRELRRLQGVLLVAAALVATVWLAATGQLVLYIHPRYVVFTVVMAVIGLLLVLGAVSRVARPGPAAAEHADHAEAMHSDEHDAHGHGHGHTHGTHAAERPGRRRLARSLSFVATAATLATASTLLVLPPATLSAATATQRDINSTGFTTDATTVDDAADASADAFRSFTVLDWSSLLRQTTDTAFYLDKPVDVVGFVTPDPDDPDDMFYVSRFVVTCCAVDAQPVGVPVYLEDWASTVSVDQWVEVSGGFVSNPSPDSAELIALVPDGVAPTGQPAEPYLY